jgi:hypothetical protein
MKRLLAYVTPELQKKAMRRSAVEAETRQAQHLRRNFCMRTCSHYRKKGAAGKSALVKELGIPTLYSAYEAIPRILPDELMETEGEETGIEVHEIEEGVREGEPEETVMDDMEEINDQLLQATMMESVRDYLQDDGDNPLVIDEEVRSANASEQGEKIQETFGDPVWEAILKENVGKQTMKERPITGGPLQNFTKQMTRDLQVLVTRGPLRDEEEDTSIRSTGSVLSGSVEGGTPREGDTRMEETSAMTSRQSLGLGTSPRGSTSRGSSPERMSEGSMSRGTLVATSNSQETPEERSEAEIQEEVYKLGAEVRQELRTPREKEKLKKKQEATGKGWGLKQNVVDRIVESNMPPKVGSSSSRSSQGGVEDVASSLPLPPHIVVQQKEKKEKEEAAKKRKDAKTTGRDRSSDKIRTRGTKSPGGAGGEQSPTKKVHKSALSTSHVSVAELKDFGKVYNPDKKVDKEGRRVAVHHSPEKTTKTVDSFIPRNVPAGHVTSRRAEEDTFVEATIHQPVVVVAATVPTLPKAPTAEDSAIDFGFVTPGSGNDRSRSRTKSRGGSSTHSQERGTKEKETKSVEKKKDKESQ